MAGTSGSHAGLEMSGKTGPDFEDIDEHSVIPASVALPHRARVVGLLVADVAVHFEHAVVVGDAPSAVRL
jgi:hypothetical protein